MGINQNPFLLVASSSARFAMRRTMAKAKHMPRIETIIVDIDRTLTTEDSAQVALERVYGKEEAKERLADYSRKVKRREMGLDQLHMAIFADIYAAGFRQADWTDIMKKLEYSGGFRKGLAEALLRAGRDFAITPVLATRGSDMSAQYVARSLGFRHAIGSIERVRGHDFAGFETIIGAKDSMDGDTIVMTKMTAVSKLLASAGLPFDPQTSAVLSNDVLDVLEMLGSACGILLRPKNPNSLERMAQSLGLYDRTIDEGKHYRNQLISALGFAERR